MEQCYRKSYKEVLSIKIYSKSGAKMEHNKNFRSISIRADLIADVERFIQKSKMYRSIAEFVSEAIRLRLLELRGTEKIVAETVEVAAE